MKIKLIDFGVPEHQRPYRPHGNDAGADVYLPYDCTLQPGEIAKIPLGFGLEIPDGYAGYIFPRTSMAVKGLVCELPPVDSGYRGEIHAIISNVRNQLKTMNRQFGFYIKHTTAMKPNLIGILDPTYPGVNTYFDSPARSDGSQKWVDFASTYWHVDCVRKMSLNSFIDHYQNWCKRKKYNFSQSKAEEIYGKAKELVPVLSKDAITKLIIKQAVDPVSYTHLDVYKRQMLRLLHLWFLL